VKADLGRIFQAAVSAVAPDRLLREHLVRDGSWVVATDGRRELARWRRSVLVIGAGKAAARMAAGCEEQFGAGRAKGFVTIADGCGVPLQGIEAAEAGHPVPDARGVDATRRMLDLVARSGNTPVLCLIAGGASSLMVGPRPPVTLAELKRVNRLLLASGADIAEVNTVRKHLSTVKGGGLLRAVRYRPLVSLVLSDVVGDDPRVIGSGPTVPDAGTFADALDVLERRNILERTPPSVRALLARGLRGALTETVKPEDPEAKGSHPVVVGTNRMAIRAAGAAAARMGYEPVVCDEPIAGATVAAAAAWGDRIKREIQCRPSQRLCVIAGGETTVEVKGSGRGGRNQEFALALVGALAGLDCTVLSAGTDGVDGPTDAAGAFVDGHTRQRARALELDPEAFLRANDSYTFFSRLRDLFRCGPTGTNVMDIKVALARGVPSVRSQL